MTRKFKKGDKVVYPHHGAGSHREDGRPSVAFGEKQDYLVLRLAYGDLILMSRRQHRGVGLRDVINDEEVEEVFAVLRKKEARMPTNWSRRYKNHSEKLRSRRHLPGGRSGAEPLHPGQGQGPVRG